ncbi:MAG TPA: hypothetical protein VLM05_21370 [Mycobacteriales bacterium]|nr:hypothetical protein [Mycobacteriales bacterium]
MADQPLTGPITTVQLQDGTTVPFYVVPFDADGACSGPRAAADAVADAAGATDVFLFSHGWNNNWKDATDRYYDFLHQFSALRGQRWEPPTRPYRPVLVGIFWPSEALVSGDDQAPDIAAETGLPADRLAAAGAQRSELDLLAQRIPAADRERFYELADAGSLDDAAADELTALLAPALAGPPDELGDPGEPPTPKDLKVIWEQLPAGGSGGPVSTDTGGLIDDGAPAGPGPETAGLLDVLKKLDPRQLVRAATVLLMKDRAGRVGARGVHDLLGRLVAASPDVRVHLVGHSYGGKVVLSALCAGDPPVRPVDSVLLLEPAMSALCFATDVDGTGRPGGYRAALERSRLPILTTFSGHDVPLTKLFHLAVRRASDLGEAVIAGVPLPSRYAALGGFGPYGCDADSVVVQPAAAPAGYPLSGPKRVVAVQGDSIISGHGAVTNPATAWMLLDQVMS